MHNFAPVNKSNFFMRLGVHVYLVLRLVVGFFMLSHALYSIVTFSEYTLTIVAISNYAKVFENEFFTIAAPLFPFIEFALGAFILLGLYYKKALAAAIFLSVITICIFIIQSASSQIAITASLFIILCILFIKSKEYVKERNVSNTIIRPMR